MFDVVYTGIECIEWFGVISYLIVYLILLLMTKGPDLISGWNEGIRQM